MKIAVIAPSALPSRRANAIQTMQMAQAFARLGHAVLLVTYPSPFEKLNAAPPTSLPLGEREIPSHFDKLDAPPPTPRPEERGADWKALAEEYGLEMRFEVRWLKARDWARRYDFALQAVWAAQRWRADCLFTRLPQAAAAASLSGMPTIFEAHDLPRGGAAHLFRIFLLGRGAKRVVAISKALAEDLMETFPSLRRFPEGFLILAPDGVDLRRYTPLLSPAQARQKLRENGWEIPAGFIAGYTGHLYQGRGAEWIVEMAAAVPEVHFLVVGGEAEQCQQLEQLFKARGRANYTLTGIVAPSQVALFQMACDVLLMPYQTKVAASSGGDIGRYLSPMKLFEYLASARPILASDLLVLREVLNNQNAILLPIQDLDAWKNALRLLRENLDCYQRFAEAARRVAENYRWESRAARILSE